MNRNTLLKLWGTFLLVGTTLVGVGQPTADFTANRTQGCEGIPLLASFQDLSTGNPASWEWQFGDAANSSSTLQNPTFIYSQPGCYDVTLIVTNPFGSDTLTQTCFVEIFPAPVPDFTPDVTSGCIPFTVNFTDISQANDPGGITSWTYILSDGQTSSNASPSFNFIDINAAPDTISVALTIRNANGCETTAFFDDIITTSRPPIVDFTLDTGFACNPPLTVNFSNLTVENGAINPVYNWTFPGGSVPAGGNTFTGQTPPPVAYNNVGQFDASLIISSDNGCEDTITLTNVVRIGGVTADFSVSATTACIGEPITFQDISTGGVSLSNWDFGEFPGVDTSGTSIVYAYSSPGLYSVTLFAENAQCGDTITRTAFIQVFDRPTASFTVDRRLDCQPGNPFMFTDASIDAVSYNWDFGDGSTSTQQNPTHTYTQFGRFPICLTVVNAQGCDDTFCDTVEIAPPAVNFYGREPRGCIPLVVEFVDTTISPVDPIISWEWDFGDGNTSTLQNPTHTFTNQGRYNIRLIVTTAGGCTDTLIRRNYVEAGTLPVAGFSADKTTVCVQESLNFFADSSNSDWMYLWDFTYIDPGSFVQFADTVPFAYPDTGTYSVALIVDNIGCRDTFIRTNYIFVSPPIANFGVDQSVLCGLPGLVTITDSSVGPSDQYDWFLNGLPYFSSTTPQNPPPLNISTPGVYTLTQAILNTSTGCTDTFSLQIFAGDPTADFTANPLVGCAPLDVTLTNNSQNFQSLRWDFIQNGSSVFRGNPGTSIRFDNTGNVTAELIVTDGFGCRDTLTRVDYISVIGPNADFSGIRRIGCPGEVINFTDLSTTFMTTITNWEWSFQNGTPGTSNLQNPTSTFTSQGRYDVALIVTDDAGCADTLQRNNYIRITLPRPSFNVVDTSTCAGLPIQFNNTSSGFGLTYLWKFGDGDTSTSIDPTHPYFPQDSVVGTFFDVTLIATDNNGCVDSITLPNYIFIEPFDARFFALDTVGVCPPFPVQVVDTSLGNVVAFIWDFGDGFSQTVTTDSAGNVYRAPGFYDVQLIAQHEDGCFDTLLKRDYIFVAGPNGNYEFVPNSGCLGDTICLSLNAFEANRGFIDWKDGSVDSLTLTGGFDSTTLCHLYPTARRYIPDIILEDDQGCVFQLPTQDSVQIFSVPFARIFPQDTAGCSPFTVPFIDSTIEGDAPINSWLWTLGNGDSAFIPNPNVTYLGDTVTTITLAVVDTNGCSSFAQTSLTSYEGAIPDFIASDTTGCAPINITFGDLSTNRPPTGWTWIFGDGDTISGVSNPSHTYTQDGLYDVTLIVSDDIGCSDTLTKIGYIDLFRPDARLYSDLTIGCNPVDINFFGDSTSSRRPISFYDWCLVNVATNDTSCQNTLEPLDSLTVNFDLPGEFIMVLTVTDTLNCRDDSDPLPISIVERLIPDPLEMRNVSVVDRNSVEITWAPYQLNDFVNYVIYRVEGNNAVEVGRVIDQNTNRFVDSDPNLDTEANSYCYKVTVLNFCDEESLIDLTEEHCTINLEVGPLPNALILSWSPYVGYQVGQYEIYRTDSYDLATLTFVALVNGDITSYIDTAVFCSDSVSYRVLAIGLGGIDERSYSDLAGNAPINEKPTEEVDVITATVVDDQYVSLSWTPYTGYLPDRYQVQRSLDGIQYDSLITLPLSDLSYDDLDVLVDEQSYFYRVLAFDECGDTSQLGNHGRTILLNAALNPAGSPILSWNAYERWDGGVVSYTVQVFNEATGQWENVGGPLPGNQTSFTDEVTNLPQPQNCYRIIAEEAGGNNAESVSNEDCVIFNPQVYIPNAFTPNNDGNNDRFTMAFPNVESVEVSIYNRWGQLLFRTRSTDEFWDGTYKGSLVQEGVYVYVVTGAGFNGTTFSRTGTVTLYY